MVKTGKVKKLYLLSAGVLTDLNALRAVRNLVRNSDVVLGVTFFSLGAAVLPRLVNIHSRVLKRWPRMKRQMAFRRALRTQLRGLESRLRSLSDDRLTLRRLIAADPPSNARLLPLDCHLQQFGLGLVDLIVNGRTPNWNMLERVYGKMCNQILSPCPPLASWTEWAGNERKTWTKSVGDTRNEFSYCFAGSAGLMGKLAQVKPRPEKLLYHSNAKEDEKHRSLLGTGFFQNMRTPSVTWIQPEGPSP